MDSNYAVFEKEEYVLIVLGNANCGYDRDLPIPDHVEELKLVKKKPLALDISNIIHFSSPLANYVMTVLMHCPHRKVNVIDSRASEKISTLEARLNDAHIGQYARFYSSIEEFEKTLN